MTASEIVQRLVADHPDVPWLTEVGVSKQFARTDLILLPASGPHMIEVKAHTDSLNRLDRQVRAFRHIFERLSVACSSKHVAGVEKRIPRTWGLYEVGTNGEFSTIRLAVPNPDRDVRYVVHQLWKSDCTDLLKTKGFRDQMRYTHSSLVERVVRNLTESEIFDSYSAQLLRRANRC